MNARRPAILSAAVILAAWIANSVSRAQAPSPPAQPQLSASPPPPAVPPPASVSPPAPASASPTGDARRPPAVARLPGEITTIQYLEAPDRRFQFKATAGAIPIYDAGDGSLQAEIAYVAY